MNVIQAVESGKRRRPIRQQFWYEPNDTVLACHIGLDWEIEELKIELTESEFDEAARDVIKFDEIDFNTITQLKKMLFQIRRRK